MRSRVWAAVGCAVAAYVGGVSTVQTQAPQPVAQASTQQPAPQDGRGRGRGLGGSNATDAANADADFSDSTPVLPLTPAEQNKRFLLQPGYRIAPVLADPD